MVQIGEVEEIDRSCMILGQLWSTHQLLAVVASGHIGSYLWL